MNSSVYQSEQEYFNKVEAIIQINLDALNKRNTALKSELIHDRKEKWEINRPIVRDFDDAVTLNVANTSIGFLEAQYERNQSDIIRLMKMRDNPYFGRLDIVDDEKMEVLYFGIYSLVENSQNEIYVIDWRAPIASLFYNYDLGTACYETPSCKKTVNITRKRQYRIENGRFLYGYDSYSSMHDQILGDILSKNTDTKLKVIIGSIQKEQNKAIRSEPKQSCLIYGLAGSGKTSVGLHRISYILYQNREIIHSKNILIISNSNIFESYISTLLPDLGEQAAETIVFSDILESSISQKYHVEEYYEQIYEVDKHVVETERDRSIKLKYSTEMAEYFFLFFQNFTFQVPLICYKNNVIFSQEIYNANCKGSQTLSFKRKYEILKHQIEESISIFFLENKKLILQDIIQDHDEYLLRDEVHAIYKRMLRQYIHESIHRIESMNQIDSESILTDILSGYINKYGGNITMVSKLSESLLKKELLYEDALLYMFVKVLKGDIEPNFNIVHTVIDEAQDYNLIQMHILKILYPRSSFTLLADIHQAPNPISTIQNYDSFEDVFGKSLKRICLNKSYRSSREINALAFNLISKENSLIDSKYTYFDRKSDKPKYFVTVDVFEYISRILKQLKNTNTIAIITNDIEEAYSVSDYFQTSKYKFQLVVSPADMIMGRNVIMPLFLAKGLEFDAAILINLVKKNIDEQKLRRKMYLGCTRALHKVFFIEKDIPPAFLDDCKKHMEIYDLDGKKLE